MGSAFLLLDGFKDVLTWNGLLSVFVGSAFGITIGALPGLNASMGVALLLPLTYGMAPLPAVVMLLSIYCGAIYGGSITAILLRTPGTTAAACTVFDGYEMAQNGEPGRALSMAATASFIGGIFSVIVLVFLSPPLARMALMFGPAEYFALCFFGLSIITSLSTDNMIKGLVSAVAGLLLGTVGIDIVTGVSRFTFDMPELLNGVSFIPVLIGLFAVSQVLVTYEKGTDDLGGAKQKISGVTISWKDLRDCSGTIARSSVIGTIVGILPGAGATMASFISYNEARRWSKHPELYGKGFIEGIAAPESANNAATGGAMVPLLSLGIPGSETTAVLIGAFMIQGLRPGPLLFRENPQLIYGLFAGMVLANIAFFVLGMLGSKLFAQVTKIPNRILLPVILLFASIGSFAESNSLTDVFLMYFFGVVGYFMRKFEFPVAPLVLALVLGPMAESNLRRALIISAGNWSTFATRPISAVLLLIGFLTLIMPFVRMVKDRKKAVAA
ncbi:MAG: tripartite tricarboxylate transporter permease [Synergistaceae bacterium]|jgi:putative tricarboxylic transport membrane protein|nr:tripartite tricarboxylate transporter permease [Synergistaceae bacterium]